jgi:hypothetical protein
MLLQANEPSEGMKQLFPAYCWCDILHRTSTYRQSENYDVMTTEDTFAFEEDVAVTQRYSIDCLLNRWLTRTVPDRGMYPSYP